MVSFLKRIKKRNQEAGLDGKDREKKRAFRPVFGDQTFSSKGGQAWLSYRQVFRCTKNRLVSADSEAFRAKEHPTGAFSMLYLEAAFLTPSSTIIKQPSFLSSRFVAK